MTHQISVDIISERLSEYINEELAKSGLSVVEVRNALHATTAKARGTYERAILVLGEAKEDSLLINTSPGGIGRWDIEKKLIEVFAVLGIPSTQHHAYHLANKLKRNPITKVLGEVELKKLVTVGTSPFEIQRITKWAEKARALNARREARLALLDSVTQEERDFGESLNFDWYYSYNDDIQVYRRGRARHEQVKKAATELLSQRPHLFKVVETVAGAHHFNPTFFVG